MKTALIASLALALLACAALPASAETVPCSTVPADGGVLGNFENAARDACAGANAAAAGAPGMAGAVTASALTQSGDMQAKAGDAVSGATGLANVGALTGAAGTYVGAASAAAGSAAYNLCHDLGLPTCTGNPGSIDTQACPTGVAVPQPFTGLLGHQTYDADAALQSTCGLANGVVGALPAMGAVNAYETRATGDASAIPMDGFQVANDSFNAACLYLYGHLGCP